MKISDVMPQSNIKSDIAKTRPQLSSGSNYLLHEDQKLNANNVINKNNSHYNIQAGKKF